MNDINRFKSPGIRSLFIVFTLVISGSLCAGKTGYPGDEDPVLQQLVMQLETALQAPKGAIYLFGSEHQLKGNFIYDITIRKKGEVATVFSVSCVSCSIAQQNLLKDKIKSLKFDIKIPKGKSYKFRYEFNFDNLADSKIIPDNQIEVH